MPSNYTVDGVRSSMSEDYLKIGGQFQQYHKDPINVLLHFLTTPIGLIGAVSFIRKATESTSVAGCIVALYLLSLLPILPNGDFYGTVILSASILLVARQLRLGFLMSAALIILGYLLQDLAHLGTGEETFQSTYSGGGHIEFSSQWLWSIVEHTYYLLPLCVHAAMPHIILPSGFKEVLAAPIPIEFQQLHVWGWLVTPLIAFVLGSYCLDSKNSFCVFPGTPYFHRVLRCNIVSDGAPEESRKEDLKSIRDWVMDRSPSETSSTHWWYKDLEGDAKNAFDRVANARQIFSVFRSLFSTRHYCMDVISGMNEIYVTGPSRFDEVKNSDQIFYTRHVDGPWGLIPFVSVYRCIVGMDRNMMITTCYPLANLAVNACEGDVIAFDFNREVHYITCDESKRDISDKFRVTLKLHYCVYPRILAPLGWFMKWLNTRYNIAFRALFLKTIKPQNAMEHFLAWNVTFNTDLFNWLETHFGQRNLIYLATLGLVWHVTGCYEIFFALTSFVHYCRYISTFYVRRGIDFGSFKRDVLLFKTIALAQLFYHYIFPQKSAFQWDWISVAMIASGYTVSLMATEALGIDRTYFAAELGLAEPKWINKFPYGYIPHPMIISQIWALLGLYKADHFRLEAPYVIPMHIACYVVHMLQEHFDIYKRYPEGTKPIPNNAQLDGDVMSKYNIVYNTITKKSKEKST